MRQCAAVHLRILLRIQKKAKPTMDGGAAAAQDVAMSEPNQCAADAEATTEDNACIDDPVDIVEGTAPAATGKGSGPADAAKCVKCMKRYGKSTCSQLACIKCCTDIDGCEGHRALRDERRRQEAILAGTHAVNVRAAQQRKMAVTPGAFPGEPALRYLRESLIVWDCRQYLDHPRWREDAIRRSERNKRAREVFAAPEAEEDETGASKKKKEGRKRRFQRIMNELYEASVKC